MTGLLFDSSAEIVVIRDREKDRHCCGQDLAALGSSTWKHAAGLICTGCNMHASWLSHPMAEAVVAAVAAGIKQPISLCNIEESIPVMAKDATQSSSGDNRGALFANDRKTEGDNRPNFTGRGVVNGVPIKISGWSRVASNGTKYMALAFRLAESSS
jgi:hypothetical protein